jgi:putative salt-induced outer membrane protein YdiY
MKQPNKLIMILLGAGIATSGHTLADDKTDALERLEAARIAFEAARAELEAAQADAAGLVRNDTVIDTNDSSKRAQPADDAESELPDEPTSWAKGWDWTASVGFNGASGNNENFSARATLGGERITSKYETSLSMSYIYSTSDGTQNTSRGEANFRNNWITEGKWGYFAEGKYEFDEFQAWDHRLSGAGGVTYKLYSNDKHTLVARAGLGGSYEMGGDANEEFVPEGLIGLDWVYQISESSTLKADTTYYASFEDFGEFRWNNNVRLEVVMDDETGLTLNTGLEHRHDSDPGSGFQNNDVDYYMGLGWKF